MNKVFLVSYCQKVDIEHLKTIISEHDILVGVDQGISALLSSGLYPHYMIGDFDSYNPLDETIELCIANNPSFRFIRLSPDKDLSDLEYAVRYFLSLGYNITIVNNLQGRIDHILSSLYLLELGEDISISSASQDVFLAKNNFSISLPLDTTISLIPISKVVTQVKTHGLLYPLENETIYRANSRGLSNKNVDKNIDISFLDGRILVVINR